MKNTQMDKSDLLKFMIWTARPTIDGAITAVSGALMLRPRFALRVGVRAFQLGVWIGGGLSVGVGLVYTGFRLFRWIRWEIAASRLLTSFDSHEDGFDFELEAARNENIHMPVDGPRGGGVPGEEPIVRWHKGRRRGLAWSLAERAYFQYGEREASEANVLITRKFMRDVLMEHKDLRAKDAARAIDEALYLSFLPSTVLRDMHVIRGTRRFRMRANATGSWWHWWGPYTGRPLL